MQTESGPVSNLHEDSKRAPDGALRSGGVLDNVAAEIKHVVLAQLAMEQRVLPIVRAPQKLLLFFHFAEPAILRQHARHFPVYRELFIHAIGPGGTSTRVAKSRSSQKGESIAATSTSMARFDT